MHVNRRFATAAYVAMVTFMILAISANLNCADAMAHTLERTVMLSASEALRGNSIPNAATGKIQVSDDAVVQRDFEKRLQKQIQELPGVTYTLQTFRVFFEGKKSVPFGSEAGIYVAMTMKYPGGEIPIYNVVARESYRSSVSWHPEQRGAHL